MKKIIATLIISSMILTGAIAQEKLKQDEPKSKIESISQQSGKLLKKEFIDLGKFKGVEVQILRLTDLSGGTTTSGVRFEYEYKSSYSSDTKVAFLDADELDGLIKSIETLQAQVFTTTPTNYTEVIFNSRSGFQAGAYWSRGAWSTYMKLERFDSNSQVFMDKDDFVTLLGLLQKAKAAI